MPEISVYYTEGGSDKEYHVQLTGTPGLLNWQVAFQYGRRGSASAGGTKIQGASEQQARRKFESLIREKVGKGYTLDISGTPFSTSVEDAIASTYTESMPRQVHAIGRHPEPEESSLHTGQRDKDLGPAPRPPEPEPTVIGIRRVTWVGRRVAGTQPQTQTSDQALQATLHSQQPLPIDSDEEVERLLDDDNWGMQDKYDGKKVTVRVKDGQGQAFNKKGEPIVIPKQVMDDVLACGRDLEIDGELIGFRYVVYDCLYLDNVAAEANYDLRGQTYQRRHSKIPRAFNERGGFGGSIEVAPLYVGGEAKRRRYEEILLANGEGVVFKRLGALFTAGKSHGDMRKKKFWASASCIVIQGREGKRSVGIALYKGRNLVNIGNVTIGGKKPIPAENSIIEVKYLYAFPGGCLHQPSYLGPRDDIDKEECLLSQLKYKQGTEVDNG
jgi:predicted DNA-binding WGR domain protein